jgi:hypothetical protein
MHIELVSCAAVQPNLGLAATALTGDSLTIKNGNPSKGVRLMDIWQTNQVAGFGQVLFPSAHDTTRGYRAGAIAGINPCQLPLGVAMEVQPQELMSVTIAGSNTAGDVENLSMLVHYGDLPGVSQRLITASECMRRTNKLTTIEASIASSAGPGYSGAELITADSDLLRANQDYAVMGMSCRTQLHAMTLQGPDTGNVRIGVPGTLRGEIQSDYFMMMSRAFGEPFVPIINSGNKSSTFIGVATDENAGTFLVTLFLALLK